MVDGPTLTMTCNPSRRRRNRAYPTTSAAISGNTSTPLRSGSDAIGLARRHRPVGEHEAGDAGRGEVVDHVLLPGELTLPFGGTP